MKLMDVFTSSKNYGHVAYNRAMEGTVRAVSFFVAALIIVNLVQEARCENTWTCTWRNAHYQRQFVT